jgi:hypothetical protein
MNVRTQAIQDLKKNNIDDFGLPIVLIDPDGVTYETDNETGQVLKSPQILYDQTKINPETGEEFIVKEPVITICKKSLSRVPVQGEKWGIRFPLDPLDPDTLTTFVITGDHAIEDGESLGFIQVFPQKAEQSL